MTETTKFRIRDLERESGVPRSRIHYYLREGILHPPLKMGKTSAFYDESHLKRLEDIQRIKMEHLATNKKFRISSKELKRRLDKGEVPWAGAIDESNVDNLSGIKRDIIEAALQLYSERGYYHSSLDDIAQMANVALSDIYLYFTNKREVFVESIEYSLQIINREMRESTAGGEDWTNIFLKLLEIYMNSYPKVGDMVNQLRVGVAIDDRWAGELLTRLFRAISDEISKTLQDLMDRGVIRQADSDILAFILVFIGEAIYQRVSFENQYSIEEIGKQVADWLYNGMKPLRS